VRTLPFRDVLQAVAYKLGLDPDQSNFLTNEAIAIGTFTDEWVRRVYDARDWPEWVATHQFVPNSNHIVTWDSVATDLVIPPSVVGTMVKLGRVLKVYLIDPRTTSTPVDTPFTLKDEGVHVGYEHGSTVWIRYMLPPPRFTAVVWNPGTIFAKDDVTYSSNSGMVYKSKSNGNQNHDPVTAFSLPPHPIVAQPAVPPPTVQIIQPLSLDNVGLVARPQIMTINMRAFTPPTIGSLPDPPPLGSAWVITVADNNGVFLGTASHSATGAELLSAIATDLKTQLGAIAGITASVNTTTLVITLQAAFGFQTQQQTYQPPSDISRNMQVIITQNFIPASAPGLGLPQITRITITAATTYPGAIYSILAVDSLGASHSVSYASQIYDTSQQIAQGLILAIEASSDAYWRTTSTIFDPNALTLDVLTNDAASVDTSITTTGSPWWELVPFPKAIADQVIRGAYADLLKEWGQSDKGSAEEQQVPTEAALTTERFTTTPDPTLTGQQSPLSRYKV
jgi:hypothetical protein